MRNNDFSFKNIAMLAILEEQSMYCYKCKSKREEIEFNDLPEESIDGFKEFLKMEEYKSGSKFLYCKKCDEYSMQSETIFG